VGKEKKRRNAQKIFVEEGGMEKFRGDLARNTREKKTGTSNGKRGGVKASRNKRAALKETSRVEGLSCSCAKARGKSVKRPGKIESGDPGRKWGSRFQSVRKNIGAQEAERFAYQSGF